MVSKGSEVTRKVKENSVISFPTTTGIHISKRGSREASSVVCEKNFCPSHWGGEENPKVVTVMF